MVEIKKPQNLLTSVTGFKTALTTDRFAISSLPNGSRNTPPHSSLFNCRKNSWPGCRMSLNKALIAWVSAFASETAEVAVHVRKRYNSLVVTHADYHLLFHLSHLTLYTRPQKGNDEKRKSTAPEHAKHIKPAVNVASLSRDRGSGNETNHVYFRIRACDHCACALPEFKHPTHGASLGFKIPHCSPTQSRVGGGGA